MIHGNYLFAQHPLDGILRGQSNRIDESFKQLSAEKFNEVTEDELVKKITEEFKILPLVINYDEKRVIPTERDITVQRDRHFDFDRRTLSIKGLAINVEIPYTGERLLLDSTPSTRIMADSPQAQVTNNKIILYYETTEKDSEKIKQLWIKDIEMIKQYAGWIERDLNAYNNSLGNVIKKAYEKRKKEVGVNQSLIDAIKEN